MRTALAWLVLPLVVIAVATDASAQSAAYGWTLSDSEATPYSNEGPYVDGVQILKLWYACSTEGMVAAEFDLASQNPANIILMITVKSGFLNAGSGNTLLLAVGGCPLAPRNAADVVVCNNVPGQYCFAPSSIGGVMVTVDCRPDPGVWPMEWIGYANDGQSPCSASWNFCFGYISVEDESWGGVKSLYR